MNEQLSLFEPVEDNNSASSTNAVEDANKSIAHGGETPPCLDFKIQAIQRYLDNAETEPTASISKYSPNGRKTEYYRLVYRVRRKVKAIHIKGGNTSARLANYRANRLQAMIDRGAELTEVLEQLADFNGGKSK